MYTTNQLLFHPDVIPTLENVREGVWAEYIRALQELPETAPQKLGLCLTMMQLNKCIDCETDSFRAMRGCEECTVQTLRRFKGSDEQLIQKCAANTEQVQEFLHGKG
ncbi:MAG TPA: hypothetical protein PK299_08825 [Anaerolineales bacterium]|nr:hypothetical protein [Anaerolineales bacterium]